jgi:hypothetical protein
LPGDYTADGIVDAADYIAWRKGLGTTYTKNDYDVWRANFGRTASGGASASVPEPSTAAIGMCGLIFAAAIQHRKPRDARHQATAHSIVDLAKLEKGSFNDS